MSATGVVHVLASCGAALCALVVALRPEHEREAIARRAAGLCALIAMGAALWGQRAFEAGRLRAVYSYSRSAGALLERHAHFGFASLCFAAALALTSEARSLKARRTLAALCVAFAALALCCDALVHAKAPSAALD
ncbi:MAG: hypothetical protein U0269_27020 [Polyangiales bacterium]